MSADVEHDPKTIYRMGMCDAMAIAIHERTGLPLAVFRGYFPDPDGDPGDELWDDYHAVAVVSFEGDEGPTWIDVDGLHVGMMAVPSFAGNCQDVEVRLDPVEVDEAFEIFTTEGVTEEQIDEAHEHIDGDSALSELLNAHTSEVASGWPSA